ncbi:hypothetical protein C8F01DRAFT_1123522 [Mycena amicta]|nr:hypothetical protein C8F01DRAFT_1123522 [Mycena amicta]
MGRALFSERYGCRAATDTAVSAAIVDPEPAPYHKWSISNRFDPDGDEFFENAEDEAFLDRGEVDLREHPVTETEIGNIESQTPMVVTIRADSEEPVSVPILEVSEMTHISSPSPPPTVTPRIYLWNRIPASPSSPSPTVRRTHPPAGPLTTRQSLAHMTPRRLVQNA